MAQHVTAIDLFCGCGGMTRGLVDAGIDVVCGIDVWQTAINTYKANNDGHVAICGDIRELDPVVVGTTIGTHRVDIVAGGPPCQGFSIAGKRNTNDPRNSLFMDFLRFIRHFKPSVVVMENVVGILSMKTAEGFPVKEIIAEEFRSAGYTVEYAKLLACEFGVPQVRRRVIFLAVPTEMYAVSRITFPSPTLSKDNYIPVSTILEDEELVDRSYFLSEKALEGIRKKKEKMKLRGHGFGAQFLTLNRPCYTIPARYYKDGYDALVRYSDTNVRRLTEREVSRVQTFPEDYAFSGNKRDIYMQIGNAVPCRLAHVLGEHIIKLLRHQQSVTASTSKQECENLNHSHDLSQV